MRTRKFFACILTIFAAPAGLAHATDQGFNFRRGCTGLPNVSVLRSSSDFSRHEPKSIERAATAELGNGR